MIRRAWVPLLAAVSMLLCFHGASAEQEVDAQGQTVRPTLETTLLAVHESIAGALNVDLSGYEARLEGRNLNHYATYAESKDVFADMADALHVTLQSAVEQCMPLLSRNFRSMSVPLYPTDLSQFYAPDWKCIAALYYTFGNEFTQKLAESMRIAFVDIDGSGKALSVALGAPGEIASCGDEAEQMHAKFAYAYLNTVYDDDGNAAPTEAYIYPQSYLAGIVHPLPGCLIKDCWLDPRDKGKRLHMGADIKADGKTTILSVTDGVVTHIGTLPVPGNYVVVLDPDGYEYHYYHMFEQSRMVRVGDMVRAGDPIGRVGNTGNSAANHLHLAIISPENRYLNPYDLFAQAGIEPIRPQS